MIRLHPCGIAELESFLQLEHGLDKCQRCNHAILVRRRAFNCPSCDASYHSTCLHKFDVFLFINLKEMNFNF